MNRITAETAYKLANDYYTVDLANAHIKESVEHLLTGIDAEIEQQANLGYYTATYPIMPIDERFVPFLKCNLTERGFRVGFANGVLRIDFKPLDKHYTGSVQ